MDKKILITALSFGLISIVLGAFGAHALKKVLTLDQLNSFEVGVRYMMYHALFLLFLGTTSILLPEQKNVVYNLTLAGTLFFSVSIFLLSTQALSGFNFKFLGPITPIGGVLLIAAWAVTIYYIITKKG
ncbi:MULTISPECIES: DUF423 domain-containing protein [Flavobacterium]|uniref:DUF423 domain-containing protein n=1 Tax=Flavobacterium hankyongi TaxID=1176532 RepID=A0ABP8ZNQ0_9FLAO|nr:DUF423 domain-containing protein [Flavobacterium sp. N1846]